MKQKSESNLPSRHTIIKSLLEPNTNELSKFQSKYGGKIFSTVNQMRGASIFLRLSKKEIILVKISDIEIYQNSSRFIFLGKLKGTVVWGPRKWKKVNIDTSLKLRKRGFKKFTTFRNFKIGIPKSNWQFDFKKINFKKLKIKNYSILTTHTIEGKDMITKEPIMYSYNSFFNSTCLFAIRWICSNLACSCPNCYFLKKTKEGIIEECECRQFGWCQWIPVGFFCYSKRIVN